MCRDDVTREQHPVPRRVALSVVDGRRANSDTETRSGRTQCVAEDQQSVAFDRSTTVKYSRLKPNSITLASSELAANMFEARSELVRAEI